MTRSIVTIPLLLSLAPPVRAQQGVPAPNAPKTAGARSASKHDSGAGSAPWSRRRRRLLRL